MNFAAQTRREIREDDRDFALAAFLALAFQMANLGGRKRLNTTLAPAAKFPEKSDYLIS